MNSRARCACSIGTIAILALTLIRSADAETFHCDAEDITCLILAIHESNGNGQAANTILLAPGTYTVMNVDNDADGPNGLPSISSTLTVAADGGDTAIVRRGTAPPTFVYSMSERVGI